MDARTSHGTASADISNEGENEVHQRKLEREGPTRPRLGKVVLGIRLAPIPGLLRVCGPRCNILA